MLKIIVLTLCFAAVYAAPSAEADADAKADAKADADAEAEAEAFYALHGYYPAAYTGVIAAPVAAPIAPIAPVAPVAQITYAGPRVVPLTYAVPICDLLAVDLPADVCTQSAETVCETHDVTNQLLGTEKRCAEVVNTVCNHLVVEPAKALEKRSADAEAEAVADAEAFYAAHGYYPHGYVHPVVLPAVVPSCIDVITEHCVDHHVIKEVVTPIERCHVVARVTCAEVVNKLPQIKCAIGG